jgi:hypothetical protein
LTKPLRVPPRARVSAARARVSLSALRFQISAFQSFSFLLYPLVLESRSVGARSLLVDENEPLDKLYGFDHSRSG